MAPGDEIAGRFVLDEVVSAGSIATLYRAHDRTNGEPVAVKVMAGVDGDVTRFSREARVLAEQRHPGIVRYIAHGVTSQGAPWLAMEWLEGETLGARLDRGPLPYEDALLAGSHVAAALSELHRLGVVHRDVKPDNLFLPGGDVARVKLLDLGIARVPTLARRSPTRVGTILGTPGYMAPEQVRGAAELDARADVFALGCVLYECLTGARAIDGDSVEALLGRTLLEDCPRVSATSPGVAPELDELVARMTARDPADRPADATAVVRALDPLVRPFSGRASRPGGLRAAAQAAQAAVRDPARTEPSIGGPPSADSAPSDPDAAPTTPPTSMESCLGDSERRLLSVVLVSREDGAGDVIDGALRLAAESFGGLFETLWGALSMVAVRASGAATDQAVRAARCALALRALAPTATLSMATGWAQESGPGAVGEVIDRASELLHAALQAPLDVPGAPKPVRIGDVDAGLLDARFEVRSAESGYELLGEREVVETARPVLGRATPCVGRRRELATLEATLAECVEEPVARAVLVTGPPGSGKSRVRHEFEALARAAVPALEVWSARGDPQHAGAPYALLGGLVRRVAGIAGTDRTPERRQKLRARVGRTVAAAERQRVTEFLAEVAGAPFPDAQSAMLRLARLDATLMNAEVRRAFVDLVAAECAAHPLLVVLEDLQWGDAASLRHLDAALRTLREAPLLVVAVGRPEVHEVFPQLWEERGAQEIRIGPLPRRAVETLVRHCLGESVDASTLARIVERSAGNAFFLEELVRSVGTGRGLSLPGTVLAMVHARLGALDPAARRVLRAASVFGERFWRDGVTELLGESPGGRTSEWLGLLEDRELVIPVPEGRFPGDQEYVFQSPQLRDAAYGMLTDADRLLGHRLAARWLERTGEREPVVLAEHLERGGAHARAAARYLDAARASLDASEFGNVLARAERGVSCGASGAALGTLLRLQAEAHRWRGDNADAIRCATDAARTLVPGTSEWYLALRETMLSCGRLGDRASITSLAAGLTAPPDPRARLAHVSACAGAVVGALDAGLGALARDLLAATAPPRPDDPRDAQGESLRARALVARADADLESHLAQLEEAARHFDASGNLREMCELRVAVGRGRQLVGMHERAFGALREARAAARRLGLDHACAHAELYLAKSFLTEGALEEAAAMADGALESFSRQGNRRLVGRARALRCRVATQQLDLERAVAEGEQAAALLEGAPWDYAWALTCLAEATLAQHDVARAVVTTERALACLADNEVACLEEAWVFLVHADALTLAGRGDAAKAVVAVAHARLMARADRFRTPMLRETYLTSLREHARVVTLHAQSHSLVQSTLF